MSTVSTFGRRPSVINNIDASTKIVVSILVVFLLLAVGLGSSFLRVRTIADNFLGLKDAADETLHIVRLEERLGNAWADLLEYRSTGSDDRLQAVTASLREMQRERTYVARAVTSEAAQPRLAAVGKELDRFEENIARMLALHERRGTLIATLENTGSRLIETLDDVVRGASASDDFSSLQVAHAVETLVLLSRLSVQRFLVTNSPAQLNNALSHLAEADALKQRLASLATRLTGRSGAQTFMQDIENYQDAARQLGEVSTEYNTVVVNETGSAMTSAIQNLDALATQLIESEEALAEATAAGLSSARNWSITLLAAGFLVLALIGYFLIQNLSRPLRTLTDVLDRLADFRTRFDVTDNNAKDELGKIWDSVAKLRPALEAIDTQTKMVNGMSLPVMLADPRDNFNISYMNDAAKEVLSRLREHLPCGPEEMLGRSIDMFHENPERQRRILSDPTQLPWRGLINFKDLEYFDLYVAPLFDREGVYSGTVLSWRVVTAEMTRLGEIEDDVRRTVHDINETFSAMRGRIGNIGEGVEKTRTHLKFGSEAVFSASSSVQTVASAAEQLSASISEISAQMTQSSRRSSEAATVAKDVAMRAETLSAASRNISTVVETISEIANQVSLLALNATIEAARAGEAGKGFAVVATEVKNLAVQTGQATAKVSEQTSAIQEQIANVTEGITNVSKVIEEINEVFVSVAASAEQQQVATSEISRNAQIAAEGAENATSTIQEVESFSEANREATHELSQSAEAVASANDNLSRETDRFLEVLRRV